MIIDCSMCMTAAHRLEHTGRMLAPSMTYFWFWQLGFMHFDGSF